MKVKDLIKLLENMPDDVEVYIGVDDTERPEGVTRTGDIKDLYETSIYYNTSEKGHYRPSSYSPNLKKLDQVVSIMLEAH